jgi:hypothetical protein
VNFAVGEPSKQAANEVAMLAFTVVSAVVALFK